MNQEEIINHETINDKTEIIKDEIETINHEPDFVIREVSHDKIHEDHRLMIYSTNCGIPFFRPLEMVQE